MANQPAAGRRQNRQNRQNRRRLRRRALAGSVALAAAVGSVVIPASSASADNGEGPYYFVNSPTGLCMDVAGGVAVDGAMVRSWSCNTSGAQNFVYEPASETLEFANNRGYCLDVWQAGTSEGSPIDLWPCNGGDNQKWTIPSSSGIGFIQNPISGLCLNVPGQDPNEGQQLWLWDCNPNPPQSWAIYLND
jgi:hypothetical protein